MKFEDIRITAKTGGGQEMTLKHMFHGMAKVIREIAGAGQSAGMTEQQVNELIEGAVSPLALQVSANTSDLSTLKIVTESNTTAVGQVSEGLTALEGEVSQQANSIAEFAQAVTDAQQELIEIKQKNADLESRLAALEAGANAN